MIRVRRDIFVNRLYNIKKCLRSRALACYRLIVGYGKVPSQPRKWNKTESEQFYYLSLYNNQINSRPLIGQSAIV